MEGEDYEIDRTALKKDVLLNSHYGAGLERKTPKKGDGKSKTS